jgi:hypothetical protein
MTGRGVLPVRQATSCACCARNSAGLRYPSAWCGRSALYQPIQAAIARRAAAESAKRWSHTHSSLRYRSPLQFRADRAQLVA